ncbi:hypothetical protein AAHA92_09824 [Salvia divinorum]|uniref:GRF-type domain-containing protein n=1 Tax=Salvia divinorum TaxID=28513 RepID=A0ABD1HTH7_SALDI
MADDIPDCGCGKRKMEMRCAGRSAMHAGRYYYKCPTNGKHPGSFKWCDEYHQEIPSRAPGVELEKTKRVTSSRNLTLADGVGFEGGCSHCCGNKTPNALTAHVIIGFMSLVLILLGILIGKAL